MSAGEGDLRAAEAVGCECPPCPGRGNDGHGMVHCAECCFGSGVVADLDCPIHGQPRGEAVGALTSEDREVISAVVHQNYYMPDVFAAVVQIVADRLAARANQITARAEDLRALVRRSPDNSASRATAAYADGLAEGAAIVLDPGTPERRGPILARHAPTSEAVAALDEVERRIRVEVSRHNLGAPATAGAYGDAAAIVREVRAALAQQPAGGSDE